MVKLINHLILNSSQRIHHFEFIATKSQTFSTSTNCFSGFVCQSTTITTDSRLSFQKNFNVHVISLERGDFKLSIGSLKSKFPHMIEGLLNILQSALCLQSQDFNMVVNDNEECKELRTKIKKKTSEAKQQ